MRLEHQGYRIETAGTCAEARTRFARGGLNAVILDLRLPDGDGLTLLSEFRQRGPDVPVIMLTAHGAIDTAIEAMRLGAFGFLTKPFDHHELLQRVRHAIENSALRREVADLRRIVGDADGATLVGASSAIELVRDLIARVAPTDISVLLTGESGTGKELAARTIHNNSHRNKGPFVAINCAAIPADLLESELFGHVRGAFTGANRDRDGLFTTAVGGTLFLDEIGDAPLNVQAKLLRVLQERRYIPVGSTTERETDARVIAATNHDLRADVSRGRFREDLFFRLHVLPVEMPPLRQRLDDIVLLAEVFLERAAARHKLALPYLTQEAVDWMMVYPWPGNVRELANMMEAALVLCAGDAIAPDTLQRLAHSPAPTPGSADQSALERPSNEGAPSTLLPVQSLLDPDQPMPSLKDARDSFERAYLIEVLRRSAGNITAAARIAGRNRTDFYDLLRRHSVKWRDS